MFACSCANPRCQVNGCMLARKYRDEDRQLPAPLPQQLPPAQFHYPQPWTEEDLRRIVREEVERVKDGK